MRRKIVGKVKAGVWPATIARELGISDWIRIPNHTSRVGCNLDYRKACLVHRREEGNNKSANMIVIKYTHHCAIPAVIHTSYG